MIRIENIGKVFNPRSRNRNEVLKGVSFELPEKGLVAIYGKSGSGKTTLLNIIGGLDKQDKGKIYIDGENVAGKVDKIRNVKIGFIFQNYYLERGYTIAKIMRNAMHIAGFKDESEIARRSEEVLTLVDMERFKNKQGDALSGGQKQRVAIARALIKGADVILADEPTGNLDAENTMKVMDILKEISRTKLVVIVTHEITLIKKYADSYIKLVDGKLDENTDLGEVFEYDTEHNNIYVDETPTGEVKEGALGIEFYGGKPEEKDTIQVFNDNGSIYIKAGKNVTVLDDKSEKKIIFRGTERQSEEEQTARRVPDFIKSTAKRNGRLFTAGSIFKLFRSDGTERAYSTANIFKLVFIAVIAAVICFLSLSTFEAMNVEIKNKKLDENSIYTDFNAYSELIDVDRELYKSIDIFGTDWNSGEFSYGGFASLSRIAADYLPKAISSDDVFDELYGNMPESGQVLISRALAESLKESLRLPELHNDRSILLMEFNDEYSISGIVPGDEPTIYFNRVDYINFLRVFSEISFYDRSNVFFEDEYQRNSFSTEICVADGSVELADNQVVIEINRNSLYKMMTDTSQADVLVSQANSEIGRNSTAIYITDSAPVYVKRFEITRDNMNTDIRIHIKQNVIDNIFVYFSPDLDLLRANNEGEYYFEISASDPEQLALLTARLNDRMVRGVNIDSIYEQRNEEVRNDAVGSLYIIVVAFALLILIYFFMEKAGSIRNSKEYGIYRAIGVNRSNLLFKEMLTACMNNLIMYFVAYFVVIALMGVRYAVMNVAFAGFIGISIGFFVVSALILLGVALIPYLFVLTETPAQILSKYDI